MYFFKTVWPILLLIVLSCSQPSSVDQSEEVDNALIDRYLVEHSRKEVSVKDPILLRFHSDFSFDQLPEIVEGVKLHPRAEGVWKWMPNGLLKFVPSETLEYDQVYKVILNLPTLLKKDNVDDQILEYTFKTKKLQASVKLLGLKIKSSDPAEEMSLVGEVTTNDYITSELIEGTVQVSQTKNEDLAILWTHSANGRKHTFQIEKIRQEESALGELTISWDNLKNDNQYKGKELIKIPSKGGFELMQVQVNQESDKIIELYFSRPIDPNQNLSGLISIDQHSTNLRTDVEGSIIYIYPKEALIESFSLYISDKIKSSEGQLLNKDNLLDLRFDLAKPAIRSIGSGMIIPTSEEAIFSFDAINLEAVDIEIFKIFDNNVLQFLQGNSINEGYYMEQVGSIVWQERVNIENAQKEKNQWIRVGVDLREYLDTDPAAIYQIRIGFQKEYVIATCKFDSSEPVLYRDGLESFMTYTDGYYNDYQGRDNPCSNAYYNPDRFIRKNVMMSDVGVIVKGGENGKYKFALSDIATGDPLANYQIALYDFQQQALISSVSSEDGFLSTEVSEEAAFVIINGPKGYAYLRLDDQNSNSLTEFDVSGGRDPGEIDGYTYTDRGVYRPGDTIHLNFMLDDTRLKLPEDHPITLEVFDPRGTLKMSYTKRDHVGKIFSFTIPTDQNAPTGRWRAQINVGPNKYSHGLRVEAIKPNRLKIEVDASSEIEYSKIGNRNITIESRWLYGAPAKGLVTQVDAQMTNIEPNFKGFGSYIFSDPARQGMTGINTWFKTKLKNNGRANFNLELEPKIFPGKVKAQLKTRVFEEGGNFSENYSAVNISPFDSYVGVQIPENRWGYKSIEIGEEAEFEVVVLNNKGEPQAGQNLSIGIYNIAWQWWYYQGDRYNIYRLNSSEHKEAFFTDNVKTGRDGKVQVKVDLQDVDYGRKMIRICNLETGHCTGDFFYATSYGMHQEDIQRESLAKLSFNSEQESYEVGEQIKIRIPTEEGSRLLVSIEDGQEVIMQEWVIGNKDFTEYQFEASDGMTPNIYVHVTMVQSYDDKNNDLPIRMYGVLPIQVTDVKTVLAPSIKAPNTLEPKETFEVEVKEENQRPMTYTIAIVDEGLLDLTNFQTPDPHAHFYAQRSLGVRTWDLYAHVLTGVSSTVDRMISVGGDSDGPTKGTNKKAIRFKPVVMVAGPYHIAAGATAKHGFVMPNYMGSVRAMVVAREGAAYGKAEKTITVKKPIMILPTLPRVLSPGEDVSIPVTVFATEPNIKKVNVRIDTDNHIDVVGDQSKLVSFDGIGEKVIYFKGRVKSELGIAQVKVEAEGHGHKVDQVIELDIRNPNPYTSESYQYVIDPGESWETNYTKQGMVGSNEGLLELSTLPNMNLQNRMGELLKYPYGCLEQITSAAMPQLFLSDITQITNEQSKRIDKNVNQAIRRIVRQQRSNGGFDYWPGANSADAWGSSYAGHFLTLAERRGYFVSQEVIKNWIAFQRQQSRTFRIDRSKSKWLQDRQMIEQAYRLYTLAISGEPALSAMNVLRQESILPSLAQFLLAGAYANSGKKEIARDMVANTSTSIDPYRELSYTYGSDLRDQALIAQTLLLIDRKNESGAIIKDIAQKMNSSNWYSTQTTAQAIIAIGEFLKDHTGEPMQAEFKLGELSSQEVTAADPLFLFEYNPDNIQNNTLTVKNLSSDILYANLTLTGQKSPEEVTNSEAISRNITLSVVYKSLTGKIINPVNLTRGTDLIAEVTIKNLKSRGVLLEGLALTQIFPSGWEVQSGGLSNISAALKEDNYTYRDVRDDRVYTYFDLGNQKTFKILLTATYDGTYFLPPVSCEAMYDANIRATSVGRQVEVIAPADDE